MEVLGFQPRGVSPIPGTVIEATEPGVKNVAGGDGGPPDIVP